MNPPHEQATPPQQTRICRLLLVLILCLSALIQLIVVTKSEIVSPLRNDGGQYFAYAYNLHKYGVYSLAHTWQQTQPAPAPVPDNLRPPGYPLFLLMVGTPEPTDAYLRRVSLAQAALGVLSVWLVYLIAGNFLGRSWALPVALVTAISPHLATISTNVLSESLFFFLLMAGIVALQRAVQAPGRWPWVWTGLVWGLCSLVRPTTEFLPPLLLIAVLALPRLRKFRLGALLAFACFAAVLAPWAVRNQSAEVSDTGASLMVNTLLHGSYPDFMYEGKPQSFGFPHRFDPDSKKISRDFSTVVRHIAGRFRAQPITYAQWYLIGKPIFFLSWGNVQGWDILIYPANHSPYFEDVRFAAVRLLSLALHWPLMILGLLGGLMLWLRPLWLQLDARATLAAGLVALVVAYAIAFHVIAAPFPRYGIPFRPLLYALAMLPLRAVWLRWRMTKK
jgi:4-amino-4-deoxy-L-arabinose transferase-like glycosyltransferase